MKHLVIFFSFFILLWSCNSQKVAVDYDRNIDFAKIQTYEMNEISASGLNDLDQARLYSAIEKNLKFRGVRKASNADVQLEIRPREYVSSKTNSSVGVGLGTGIGRRIGGLGGGISVGVPITSKQLNQEYTVSMYQNNVMIWEGILTLKMPMNASADVKQQSIDKGVSKLFLNYPPKK